MNQIELLKNIIEESSNIVFFGGAGCSVESGIPDFRSSNGLFSQRLNRNFTPEQAVSASFYYHHPEEFFTFYKKNLIYPDAMPNDCHKGLAKLEEAGKLKAIITQNIDGLHQAAGSKVVYELHGSVLRNYCTKCKAFYEAQYILESEGVPLCKNCASVIKPDVVLYEEGLDEAVIMGAIDAIAKADTLIIGGTSLVVYPAAGLIRYFKGNHLVLINKGDTSADQKANLVIHENIGEVFAKILE